MPFLTRSRSQVNPWPAPWDSNDDFGRLWQEFNQRFGMSESAQFQASLDVHETPEAYVIEADMPGLSRDDVNIEVVGDVVTIKGERKFEQKAEEENYHRVERRFGSFSRSLSIPGGFDADKVDANFENGVLKVTLPKPDEHKPRKIQVQVG